MLALNLGVWKLANFTSEKDDHLWNQYIRAQKKIKPVALLYRILFFLLYWFTLYTFVCFIALFIFFTVLVFLSLIISFNYQTHFWIILAISKTQATLQG